MWLLYLLIILAALETTKIVIFVSITTKKGYVDSFLFFRLFRRSSTHVIEYKSISEPITVTTPAKSNAHPPD